MTERWIKKGMLACLRAQWCEPVRCRLEHSRPGTVSVSLSENDDEPQIRQRANYRNTEFLITTGAPFPPF